MFKSNEKRGENGGMKERRSGGFGGTGGGVSSVTLTGIKRLEGSYRPFHTHLHSYMHLNMQPEESSSGKSSDVKKEENLEIFSIKLHSLTC